MQRYAGLWTGDSSSSWDPSFPDRPRVEAVLVPVPTDATVAFDLVYFVGDRKFTDDNHGR